MECSVEEDCELFSSQSSSMESVQQNPLALHQETLRECSVHPWVLTTVTKGYRLQFAVKPPPFNGVIASVATGDSARVLEAEIASLLEKRALRPIMDLRALNKHLRKYKFKMLTFGLSLVQSPPVRLVCRGQSQGCLLHFFCYQQFFILFFSHITQHSIQNITKQNNRHILNISRSSQKGGREGGTTRTQKSLLYTITYIQQKTLPSINGQRPGPTDSRSCTFTRHYLQEATDPVCFSTHVWCKPVLYYCRLRSCKTSKQHSLLH